jgi:hypothetical protein
MMDKSIIIKFQRKDKQVNIPQWPGDEDGNHGSLTVQSIEFDFNGEKWNVNAVTAERIMRLFNRVGIKFDEVKEKNESI